MTNLQITRPTNLYANLVPELDSRAAWYAFREQNGYRTIRTPYLTEENLKLRKNEHHTISFTGSPHRLSGHNVCPQSTPACRAVCIRYTGRLDMPYAQQLGIDRTRFLYSDPDAAVSLIHWETVKASKKTEILGRRLNIVSDIAWEDVAPWLFHEAPENVRTYDYTKNWDRDRDPQRRYRLTFSATERHGIDDIRAKVRAGGSVAVVFPKEHKETGYADTWYGMPVINGDRTDFRYDDPFGSIVALHAKGRARHMPVGMAEFVKKF